MLMIRTGHKATIMLEELKEAYGKDYVYQSINIMENIQKEPWFTKLGPNGRIPVLVDHDEGDLAIMEGAAILSYLTRHYDPEHKFTFTKDPELSKIEQWVAWQHGGLGPMVCCPRQVDLHADTTSSKAKPTISIV